MIGKLEVAFKQENVNKARSSLESESIDAIEDSVERIAMKQYSSNMHRFRTYLCF